MRRLIMTIALSCLLATTAWAGNIPTGDAPQPPPSVPGEINTPGLTERDDSDLADAAISSLLSALGLALL